MTCNKQSITTTENLSVMRGETIVGDFTIYDDYGRKVSTVDGITVLLADASGGEAEPIVYTIDDGVEFDDGRFRFVIYPEVSIDLPSKIGMEIKVVANGIVRIAASKYITIVDNTVKDY